MKRQSSPSIPGTLFARLILANFGATDAKFMLSMVEYVDRQERKSRRPVHQDAEEAAMFS